MAYIEVKHSYNPYHVGETEIVTNNDINFEIEKGKTGYHLRFIWCRKIDRLEYLRWNRHQ